MRETKLISEKIYLDLREKIQNGVYLPGVHLVELDLMNEYSVSRTTIRETLRRLIADEVVEQIPNKGVVVRKLSKKEIEDYYLLMQILEGAAARQVALTRDDEMIRALEEKLEADAIAIRENDHIAHTKAITEFRDLLATYTTNQPLIAMIKKTHAIASIHQVWYPLKTGMRVANMKHKELLQAIRDHDADYAQSIIIDIIQGGMNLAVSSFDTNS